MNPEIQKAIDAGKLSPAAGPVLDKLQPGTYVMHKSWGFGQIESINFLVNQVTIHFKGKRDHSMQLQYAAESLQPIDAAHILAHKASDLAGVKARAKADPVGLVRQILTSFGGNATQDQIAQTLVPEVMTEAEFKRWLEGAKKALKKDGHFAIPAKKGEQFELREKTVSHADEYIAGFHHARQVKDQIAALELILKNLTEFPDAATQLLPLVRAAGETARKSQRLHTAHALSLLLSRDEIIERTPGLDKATSLPAIAGVLRDEERQLPALLSAVPAAKTAPRGRGIARSFWQRLAGPGGESRAPRQRAPRRRSRAPARGKRSHRRASPRAKPRDQRALDHQRCSPMAGPRTQRGLRRAGDAALAQRDSFRARARSIQREARPPPARSFAQ